MTRPLLFREQFGTPLGAFLLFSDETGALRAANWLDREHRMARSLRDARIEQRPSPSPGRLGLEAYFHGELGAIDALRVETGGTEFQRSIWTALRAVRCGETLTYRQLARQVGRPAAIRAAGLANGGNPVSVVVPCHRIVGSDGALTGYGGGLDRKAWLLAHEGARPI